MSGQNPDQHQHDREREGEQLGQGEASAAAEGNPAGRDVSVLRLQANATSTVRPVHMSTGPELVGAACGGFLGG